MSTMRSSPAASVKGGSQAHQQQNNRRNGRKGETQDLNHLLGFTLPPRQQQPTLTHLPRRSNNRNRSAYGWSSGHGHGGAFDRSRFVHTFRFIVKPDKDYTALFADPDIHLDWADILQVVLPTSNSALSTVSTTARIDQTSESGRPACPICLSEPTAARMTKCGHVFCYPCVLHYLALADPGVKSRKCPVCHDAIHAKDLKSVKWFDPVKNTTNSATPSLAALSQPSRPPPPSLPSEPIDADLARALELSRLDAHPSSAPSTSTSDAPRSERLTMRLVRRPQLTTLALPRSSTWPSDAIPPLRAPWQFTPDAFAYAKFMLGEPAYMREELLTQKGELESELKMLRRFGGSDEELGVVFVREALRLVDEQIEMVELLKTSHVMTARKRALRELDEVREAKAEEKPSAPVLPPPVPTPTAPVESVDAGAVPLEFLSSRGGTPLAAAAPAFVPSAPSLATPASPPKRTPHQRRNVLPSDADTDADPAYYFYQASSGQPIFLNPLDIRILKSHFGSYAAMPDTITVGVEGADEGSMNDELRRRCKWLAHLPLASDVVFVEADLSHLVSRRSLEPFLAPLKQRRTKRRDKARKEENARKRSEQKAAEALPVFHATYAYGASVPPGGFGAGSSWDDVHAFPAPPSSRPSVSSFASTPAPTITSSSSYSRPSFASALHASSRSASHSGWDDHYDYDDRWGELEEQLGRQRASGAASPRSGSATPATPAPTGGEGKKQGKKGKKGITLNLTGMRGTG